MEPAEGPLVPALVLLGDGGGARFWFAPFVVVRSTETAQPPTEVFTM